jgi:hypothetical protein
VPPLAIWKICIYPLAATLSSPFFSHAQLLSLFSAQELSSSHGCRAPSSTSGWRPAAAPFLPSASNGAAPPAPSPSRSSSRAPSLLLLLASGYSREPSSPARRNFRDAQLSLPIPMVRRICSLSSTPWARAPLPMDGAQNFSSSSQGALSPSAFFPGTTPFFPKSSGSPPPAVAMAELPAHGVHPSSLFSSSSEQVDPHPSVPVHSAPAIFPFLPCSSPCCSDWNAATALHSAPARAPLPRIAPLSLS